MDSDFVVWHGNILFVHAGGLSVCRWRLILLSKTKTIDSMKKIFLLACILSAGAAVRAEQPRDWAQYGRYAAQNAEIDGAVEAVFMGNSITDHWIGQDPDFFERNAFVDRGISGQTSVEMLARFRRDVIDLHPKAVVILAGINDIAQNMGPISLENTFGNIVSMCELARYHRIRVVLCSVLPCDRFSWRPEIAPAAEVVRLNEMLKRYAEQNRIVYVDYHTAFDNGQGGLDARFSHDGCHPTLYGYTLMEPLVTEGINQALHTKKRYYVTPVPEE